MLQSFGLQGESKTSSGSGWLAALLATIVSRSAVAKVGWILSACVYGGDAWVPHPALLGGLGALSVTPRGCKWEEALLAMLLSFGGGAVVGALWKAKGPSAASPEVRILEGPGGHRRPVEAAGADFYVGEDFVDKETQTEHVPWGPDELVAFATSMAGQVANKLSQQEEHVRGVVERFTEDLLRLSRGQGEPHLGVTAGAGYQDAGDLLW